MWMPKDSTPSIVIDISEDFDTTSNVIDSGGIVTGEDLN